MVLHWNFYVGVVAALLSGIVVNVGTLLQKRGVNNYLAKQNANNTINGAVITTFKVSAVVRERVWIFGFSLQLFLGTALFIWSQTLLGPSLPPALGSVGLVVIALPQLSSGVVQEKLTIGQMIGIVMIIAAVILLSFSGLQIPQGEFDFLEPHFLIRVLIYTGSLLGAYAFCKMWSKKHDKFEGVVLATSSGIFIALSNFWISPFTAILGHLFSGHFRRTPTFLNHSSTWVILFWLLSVAFVVWFNVQSIYEKQLAFKVGQATTMIPISHVPSHLSPPIIYACVFFLPQTYPYSLAFMCVGIVLLVAASFIFGRREAAFVQQAAPAVNSYTPLPADEEVGAEAKQEPNVHLQDPPH